MSVEQDIFVIGVIGSRKNITRMLNAAIHNVVAGEPIVESDDIETTNRKLGYFTGREGHNIGIFDLLDEECMKDEAVIGKKEAFYNRVKACENCPFDCPNSKLKSDAQPLEYGSKEMEEYCPWPDPYYAEDAPTEPNRYIEMVRVEENEKDYTAKFTWYLYETYEPSDWADWEDIARLYDCRVFVDDDYYRNGEFIKLDSATIYEPGGEKHRFESGTTREEYDKFIDKMAGLYPERYSPIRTRYLKEKEDEKERQQLEEDRQIKLHYTAWSRFASWEEDGIKAIKGVYDGFIEDSFIYPNSISAQDILNVLKVRAEKWRGVNDEFAGCYEELIRNFNDDYEQKRKELEAEKAATASDDDYKWLDEILNVPTESQDDENESLYPIDGNGHAVIPDGTTVIDDYAFLQCNKLVSVSIPDTVEEIGEGSFGSCENLESITLPSSLRFIDEAAFFGCKGLRSVVIPGGVKMIDARAFAECTTLSKVHLPAGVAIDSSAFNGSPSYMYFEFGTVKQMINAVGEAISNGSLLHFSGEPDNTTQIYHTKKFKEKIVLRYRKNKIFYTICVHNTLYDSWTIHQEKVLKNFIKLYESTK